MVLCPLITPAKERFEDKNRFGSINAAKAAAEWGFELRLSLRLHRSIYWRSIAFQVALTPVDRL
jgi:hypothetical protein